MNTSLMEPPKTAKTHRVWRPYSENPDGKLNPSLSNSRCGREMVHAPSNPIGVPELIDPSETDDMTVNAMAEAERTDFEPVPSLEWNPDLHLVMRALRQAHQADRLIQASQEGAKLPGYRELVRYSIEFVHEGRRQAINEVDELQTVLPPAPARAETSAPRQRRAERLQAVIHLRDPATTRVEEQRLPLDIAFLKATEPNWPTPDTIMLSAEGGDPTVEDLAELITDACFAEETDNGDDSLATQVAHHRDHAYKTAANLLLPRHLALAAVVERHIKSTFESFLKDGEALKIKVIRRQRGRIETNVTTAVPPPKADTAEDRP